EDQYGRVLEAGKLKLGYADGAFHLDYYATRLPVAPATYRRILAHRLPELEGRLGPRHDAVQELQSILTAIGHLPPRTELDPDHLAVRDREKEVIKRRIAHVVAGHPEARDMVDHAVRDFNGDPADRRSFDPLDALLGEQAYRLAFWRVAAE